MSKIKSQHLETYPRLSVGIREMNLAGHNRRRSRRRAASKSSSLNTRQGVGAVGVSGIRGLATRGSFPSSLFLNRACQVGPTAAVEAIGSTERGTVAAGSGLPWLDRKGRVQGACMFGPSPTSSPKTNFSFAPDLVRVPGNELGD